MVESSSELLGSPRGRKHTQLDARQRPPVRICSSPVRRATGRKSTDYRDFISELLKEDSGGDGDLLPRVRAYRILEFGMVAERFTGQGVGDGPRTPVELGGFPPALAQSL